jgi:hypothetical protein
MDGPKLPELRRDLSKNELQLSASFIPKLTFDALLNHTSPLSHMFCLGAELPFR